MSQDESTTNNRSRRERSTRYPGVPLADCVELCKFIESRGLDGLTAADIATALGYKNIKTNTFSARLSAGRQFGLLTLSNEGYSLTPLARSILHPVDLADLPRLYRQAFVEPPIYADLVERMGDKRVPDVAILGNVLYHNHQIIASAKESAAEAFLASARFAGQSWETTTSSASRARTMRRHCRRVVGPRARPPRAGQRFGVVRRPDRPPPLGRRRGQDDPRPRARVDHARELRSAPPGAPAACPDRGVGSSRPGFRWPCRICGGCGEDHPGMSLLLECHRRPARRASPRGRRIIRRRGSSARPSRAAAALVRRGGRACG